MSEERIQQRIRRWGERLTENSSLRDELNDEQAHRLVSWALARLAESAARVDVLPEEAAEARMEALYDALRRLMRQVGGLTPHLAYLVEDELAENLLLAFASTACEVTGRELDEAWFNNLLAQRLALAESALFDRLMAALDGEEGGHEPGNAPPSR